MAVSIGSGGSSGLVVTGSIRGALAATYASGSGGNVLYFTLPQALYSAEAVTLNYTQPGNGLEGASGGGDLASIVAAPVANNSAQATTTTTAAPTTTTTAAPTTTTTAAPTTTTTAAPTTTTTAAPTTTTTAAPGGLPGTDNFDSGLSASWLAPAGAALPTASGGKIAGTSALRMAFWNAVFADNQYSQAQCYMPAANGAANDTKHRPAPAVRMSPDARNGYFAVIIPWYDDGEGYYGKALEIWRMTNGTPVALLPTAVDLGNPGGLLTVKITAEGSTIKAYVNGVLKATATDATHLSGKAGIIQWDGAATADNYLDNWEGGNI
jgi:hypothetical protein